LWTVTNRLRLIATCEPLQSNDPFAKVQGVLSFPTSEESTRNVSRRMMRCHADLNCRAHKVVSASFITTACSLCREWMRCSHNLLIISHSSLSHLNRPTDEVKIPALFIFNYEFYAEVYSMQMRNNCLLCDVIAISSPVGVSGEMWGGRILKLDLDFISV